MNISVSKYHVFLILIYNKNIMNPLDSRRT